MRATLAQNLIQNQRAFQHVRSRRCCEVLWLKEASEQRLFQSFFFR